MKKTFSVLLIVVGALLIIASIGQVFIALVSPSLGISGLEFDGINISVSMSNAVILCLLDSLFLGVTLISTAVTLRIYEYKKMMLIIWLGVLGFPVIFLFEWRNGWSPYGTIIMLIGMLVYLDILHFHLKNRRQLPKKPEETGPAAV